MVKESYYPIQITVFQRIFAYWLKLHSGYKVAKFLSSIFATVDFNQSISSFQATMAHRIENDTVTNKNH
jgi:hypothetical protein